NVVLGQPEGERPVVIDSKPFWKGTLGAGYTWSASLYSNIQWVHGFIDEFGAGDVGRLPQKNGRSRVESIIGDYLVLGSDLKLFHDALLIRLFGAFKIPDVGDPDPAFTAVIFPQATWTVWNATELAAG